MFTLRLSRPFFLRFATLAVGAMSACSTLAHATVNPFVAPAHEVCLAMARLAQDITTAVADGVVTPAEKEALQRAVTKLAAAADRLVAAQGVAASVATAAVLHHLSTNTVGTRGPYLVQTLNQGRALVWAQAKKDRTTNPFAHLRGYTKVSPGIVAHRLAAHGTSWVVAADLAQPRLRLLSNKLHLSGANFASIRVDENAKAGHAQAAINGDFFSRQPPFYRPSGYTMTNGEVWPGTHGARFEPSVAWAGQHVMVLPPHRPVPTWARNVISARPTALEAGRPVTHFAEPDKAARSRRTGIGLSADGRVVYFVSSTSATATDIGKLLRSVGAHDGFTMDGGGSAQLYVTGHGFAQKSSDPIGYRRVANVLMLRFR